MTSFADKSNTIAGLGRRLKGNIVIVGVGNGLRADDGAGPWLIEMLRERLGKVTAPPSCHLVDCGETPENYIGSIAGFRPDAVLVVDSASLGLPAGATRMVEAEGLSEYSPSTHGMSPALFMNRLREETGADVFMVAVQPATTAFGVGVSVPMVGTLMQLAELIENAVREGDMTGGCASARIDADRTDQLCLHFAGALMEQRHQMLGRGQEDARGKKP